MVFTVSDCYAFIIPVCIGSCIWALFNAYLVSCVNIQPGGDYSKINDDENGGKSIQMIAHIGKLIQVGADEFLFQEYKYLGIFCSIFALVILFAVDIYGG
jgi:Na+/H+-translocating membrane pyrophosphatase